MASKIRYTLDAEQVREAIARIERGVDNLRPAWEGVARYLVSRINLGFRGSRSPWGEPWLPLKLRQGQPLRDTGRLQRSITSSVDDRGVDVGTNLTSTHRGVTYLWPRVHQFGAVIRPRWAPFLRFRNEISGSTIATKRVTIPARPFLPLRGDAVVLPDQWRVRVLEILATHVLGERVA